MSAGCSLVLYSIHILLDFSSVDFQCMLEVLGLLLLIPGSIRFCIIHAYKYLKGFLVMTIYTYVPLLLCLYVFMIL